MNAMMTLAQQENKAAKSHWDKGQNISRNVGSELSVVMRNIERDQPDLRMMRDIVKAAADVHGVTVGAIKGHSRKKEITKIRQYCMWKSKQCGYSLNQIGNFLNRHHTTVMHGCDVISAILEDGESL
ncbi:MAG: helix-turn-helix domain-containing protein [Pikeienuella sp.]